MGRLIELSKSILRWLRVDSKRGVSAIEYGLLAALMAVVMVTGVSYVGQRLNAVFIGIGQQLNPPR